MLFLALFLLGYGWNLGFVAGSTLLTHGVDVADRTRLQGAADSLIWSSSALASLGSGIVLAFASYAALGPARRGARRDPALGDRRRAVRRSAAAT